MIAFLGTPRTVSYAYDLDGNRISLTYPSGTVVTYGYTNRNQVSTITANGTQVASYAYDGDGNVLTKGLANSTATAYTYDAADRLTTVNHTLSGTSFARFDYGYDSVNRHTYEQRDTAAGDTYAYDGIDQVTGVNYEVTSPTAGGNTGAGRLMTYAYDATGNRTAVTDNVNGNTSYTANNLNQYTAVGGSAYSYDGNGNLGSGNGMYLYDAQNRLTNAVVGGNSDQFSYDSRNRVVERQVGTTPVYLIYDGWDLIEERDASGNVLSTYIHGVRQDELLSKTSGTTTVFYHHNALGSVTDLTDVNGNLVEKYKYDAFGKPTICDGSGNVLSASAYGNRFLFTGREFLAEVNLYDYRNRVYSADLGRFLQTDPIRFDAGDVNIYRYCTNDPVNFYDPLGLVNLNLFNPNTQTVQYDGANETGTTPGTYTVAGHGNPGAMEDPNNPGQGLTPQQVANMILADPNYKPGEDVTLDACSTGGDNGGDNFAQQLADILNANVTAPTTALDDNTPATTYNTPFGTFGPYYGPSNYIPPDPCLNRRSPCCPATVVDRRYRRN